MAVTTMKRTYEHIAVSDEMVVVDKQQLLEVAGQIPNLKIHWTADNKCTVVIKADVYDIGDAIGPVDEMPECVMTKEDVEIYDSMLDLIVECVEDGVVVRTATWNNSGDVMLRKITFGEAGVPTIEVL